MVTEGGGTQKGVKQKRENVAEEFLSDRNEPKEGDLTRTKNQGGEWRAHVSAHARSTIRKGHKNGKKQFDTTRGGGCSADGK